MNGDEPGNLEGIWTALEPTPLQRQRIDARVFDWLEAHDTPLTAEWIALFRFAPFTAAGLVSVSAVAVAIATASPLVWLARVLI